jgi:hypothetical protein
MVYQALDHTDGSDIVARHCDWRGDTILHKRRGVIEMRDIQRQGYTSAIWPAGQIPSTPVLDAIQSTRA